MAAKQMIIYKIGNEMYSSDITLVKAIENYTQILRIPTAASNIKGVIKLRGAVIPVFNLRAKFGYPDLSGAAALGSKLLVMNIGDMELALEADEVYAIRDIEDDQFYPFPVIITNNEDKSINAAINIDERLVAVIDPGALMREEEKKDIKKAIDGLEE